jgi:transcriptional regulator with PAS, ATPase and Fis domain
LRSDDELVALALAGVDLEATGLASLGTLLKQQGCQVLRLWQRHYGKALSGRSFFDNGAFLLWHSEEVRGLVEALGSGGLEPAGRSILGHVRRLTAMGMSFEEQALTNQLFRRACIQVMKQRGPEPRELLRLYDTVDGLKCLRTVLMVHGQPTEPIDAIDELARLQGEVAGRSRFCGMVGRSRVMQRVYELLAVAARSRTTVLLVGESGTGKELAARAIHRLSGDSMERYVPVNCAALPRELMEDELFGHRKGAFSGAHADKVGLFQAANGGTLFLDEITELSVEAQAKLLRALQERAVRPVGATREEPVSVRVISSTNRPLKEALASGRLRRDLYYRLQGFVVEIPPLRERQGDLALLLQHFLEISRPDRPRPTVSAAALQQIQTHSWPGNVRELQMSIERACATSKGETLQLADLFREERSTTVCPADALLEELPLSLKRVEEATIVRALKATGGNKARASRLLGISRKQLYVKIQRYCLAPECYQT